MPAPPPLPSPPVSGPEHCDWTPYPHRKAICRRYGCSEPVTGDVLGLCPGHLAGYAAEAAHTLALVGQVALAERSR